MVALTQHFVTMLSLTPIELSAPLGLFLDDITSQVWAVQKMDIPQYKKPKSRKFCVC